jgi:hypothetical protein
VPIVLTDLPAVAAGRSGAAAVRPAVGRWRTERRRVVAHGAGMLPAVDRLCPAA